MKKYLPLLLTPFLTNCKETEISVLTYNVRGLPSEVTDADPEKIKQISPLLNEYDIVLIQEDFVYHLELAKEAEHPHQGPISKLELEKKLEEEQSMEIKNGLSRFSYSPMDNYHRERWHACHGLGDASKDCLAPKGFSVAEHEIMPGVEIDIYNCHMDAGDSLGDISARKEQIIQLADFINRRSQYKGVIVACDTNLDQDDQYDLEQLLAVARLKDSCQILECAEPYNIDRIMYRNSPWVKIEPLRWHIPEGFVNEKGEPLSDHLPVAVDFKIVLGSPPTNR